MAPALMTATLFVVLCVAVDVNSLSFPSLVTIMLVTCAIFHKEDMLRLPQRVVAVDLQKVRHAVS